MALSRLGNYIELVDIRNSEGLYDENDVKGISTSKVFIETKANLNGVNLKNYKVVNVHNFAYVADTSRRGDKIGLAYADNKPCIISNIYTVFKVKDENKLHPRYLMMFFSRSEFDRYARFNSWGSARETFDWDTFCDIEIYIPSIEVQRKYVAIYEALLKNLNSYEQGLEDLKLVCDGYVESLKSEYPKVSVGDLIQRRNLRNQELSGKYVGISENGFIEPKQKLSDNNILRKKVFLYDDFIFTPSGVNIHNKTYETAVCSHVNEMFYLVSDEILSDYLEIWFKRSEFLRYCEYYNISSVMSNFNSETFNGYFIPIPPKNIQEYIINMYKAFMKRKEFIERIKIQIKDICPILIRGAVEESKGGN